MSYSILLSSCFCLLVPFLTVPFLSLDSVLYSNYSSSLYSLKIILLYCIYFIYSLFLSYNTLIFFPPLLIFAQLSLLLTLLWFPAILLPLVHYFLYFISNLIQFPLLTPFCHCPSLFYLHSKFYFLPFFALFLFPTLIISPHPSLLKSFFSPLVISYSFLLSYNIFNLFHLY
uniref:Uncharacterized protein n=1 Tax=Desmodus rotundus TaxID=9430 RepID=K9IGQ0_DESRO